MHARHLPRARCTRSRATSPARSSPRRCSARSTSPSSSPRTRRPEPLQPGATITAHPGAGRGAEGARRPLPAAAHGAARRHQPHPQRDLDRPRGPRRRRSAATSSPSTTTSSGSTRRSRRSSRDLRLTTTVSNTYADVVPSVAQILRNTIRTTGTLQDRHQQLQTLFTDVTSFSDTAHDFLRAQRRQHHPARPGQPARRRRCSPATRRSTPACSAASSAAASARPQAFRGFTLHIVLETLPHQPRGYTAGRPAGVRRQPRPELPPPAEPAVEPVQPGAAPAELRRRRGLPDRQGHRPGRAVVRRLHPRHRVRRRPGRGGPPQEPARSLAGRPVTGRARPRRAPGRSDGPRARRCRCDEAPRRADHVRAGQARRLHGGDRARHRRAGRSSSATSASARRRPTGPCSSTRPAWSRATTSASPASRSARSRASRSSTAPRRWSPSTCRATPR